MPYHLAIPHQCDNYFIIHNLSFFVKNFFIFFKIYFKKYSERAGIRTPDNLIKSQVLYHLSYTPLTGVAGLEPAVQESESCALPLGDTPSMRQLIYIIICFRQLSTLFLNFLNLFFKSEFFQILTVPETVRYWLPIFKYDFSLIPLF